MQIIRNNKKYTIFAVENKNNKTYIKAISKEKEIIKKEIKKKG